MSSTLSPATDSAPPRSALVVEGGAMRGIFSAGVLDAFLEASWNPFDLAIGSSAGASNLLSYLAGQRGRTRRCHLNQMSRPEFIDAWRFVRGGHWVDLDWLWDAITREDPLDCEAAAKSSVEYLLAATSAETGEPVYLRPDAEDMLNALKGSCAMPILYRGKVRVGGVHVVDGGVADPIPVREAYRRGARRIMVVRSRAADFVKTGGWKVHLGSATLRTAPAVARAHAKTHVAYAAAVDFIKAPPDDCQIVHVAPRTPLATTRTRATRETLERDYALGRRLGAEAIQAWSALDEAQRAEPASPSQLDLRS